MVSVMVCLITSVFSTPMYPWLGSNLFLPSYPRPLRFFEIKYRTDVGSRPGQNDPSSSSSPPGTLPYCQTQKKTKKTIGLQKMLTKMKNHGNTHTERTPTSVNALNALFFHSVSMSLVRGLHDDVSCGRYGTVRPGDVFLVAGQELKFFLMILGISRDEIRFQIRGLEFMGIRIPPAFLYFFFLLFLFLYS
jgi:hypothetical protein